MSNSNSNSILVINNKIHYPYNLIHSIIKRTSDKIINEFKPDIILAIGGGGLIPARILRTYIDVPVYVITIKAYNNDDSLNPELKVIQWINENLRNKKVLIVDEIDDTRTSLEFCIRRLKKINDANDLGVFVVHNKIKQKKGVINNIKYFSGEDIEDKWIVYPWEMM